MHRCSVLKRGFWLHQTQQPNKTEQTKYIEVQTNGFPATRTLVTLKWEVGRCDWWRWSGRAAHNLRSQLSEKETVSNHPGGVLPFIRPLAGQGAGRASKKEITETSKVSQTLISRPLCWQNPPILLMAEIPVRSICIL